MTTTRGFMSADVLATSGFFTAALGSDENNNVFDSSFGEGCNTTEVDKDIDPGLNGTSNKQADLLLPTNGGGSYSPFLLLSPGASPMPFASTTRNTTSSYPDLPGGSDCWEGGRVGTQIAQDGIPNIQSQEPSPPPSANSPTLWTFDDSPTVVSPLHGFLANTETSNTIAPNGQITPPSSEENEQSDTLHVQRQHPSTSENAPDSQISKGKKRRDRGQSGSAQSGNDGEASTPKRQRKSNTKSKASGGNEEMSSGRGDETQKRTRFLERNRVAASKCRQKKKEWTNNIEAKARDLQNEKNQLAIIVGSLKEEVLWLKGELLKHTDCGCDRIRQYLDQEAANLASPRPVPAHQRLSSSSITLVEKESGIASAIEAAEKVEEAIEPTSRRGSVQSTVSIAQRRLINQDQGTDGSRTISTEVADSIKSEEDQNLFATLAAEITTT